MSNDITDWKKLREFSGVDITQSFALSWHVESTALMVDLDLFLNKEHPFYEEPRPAEKACFRPAFLEFPDCTRACESGEVGESSVADAVKSFGAGKISGFRRTGDGQYEIRGEFGTIIFESDRPLLRIKDLSV